MKGNAWAHTPNDKYRSGYDSISWARDKEQPQESIDTGTWEKVCACGSTAAARSKNGPFVCPECNQRL